MTTHLRLPPLQTAKAGLPPPSRRRSPPARWPAGQPTSRKALGLGGLGCCRRGRRRRRLLAAAGELVPPFEDVLLQLRVPAAGMISSGVNDFLCAVCSTTKSLSESPRKRNGIHSQMRAPLGHGIKETDTSLPRATALGRRTARYQKGAQAAAAHAKRLASRRFLRALPPTLPALFPRLPRSLPPPAWVRHTSCLSAHLAARILLHAP